METRDLEYLSMSVPKYGFRPAAPDEAIVHGACRPSHPSLAPPDDTVTDWIDYLQGEGIERVCCLLDEKHLQRYDNLLDGYRTAFGADQVCHAPIPDMQTIDEQTLHETVLPFLRESDRQNQPVAVHCSAGLGRTGHVLALWLAAERGYSVEAAVDTVEDNGRVPLEAAEISELKQLLARVPDNGGQPGSEDHRELE